MKEEEGLIKKNLLSLLCSQCPGRCAFNHQSGGQGGGGRVFRVCIARRGRESGKVVSRVIVWLCLSEWGW